MAEEILNKLISGTPYEATDKAKNTIRSILGRKSFSYAWDNLSQICCRWSHVKTVDIQEILLSSL